MKRPVNISFELSCNDQYSIEFYDRHDQLLSTTTEFKISMPNQLRIKLTTTSPVTVNRIVLGGVEIKDPEILTSICGYTPAGQDLGFSTVWPESGNITIDLFEQSFIKYHMQLKNKIELIVK